MTALRLIAFWLLGVLATVCATELLLRVAPIPAGIAAADPVRDWPAHRLVPNSSYTSSSGWDMENIEHGHINNAGYIAPFDYVDGAKVGVVIGDSYVEGYMNPYPAMLQAQIADDLGLPKSAVYGFGSSGASLAHYFGVAGLVGRRYRPDWAVVVITSGDFVEGFEHAPGLYHWAPNGNDLVAITPEKHRSSLVKIFRDMAIVRYGRMNIRFTPMALLSSGLTKVAKPKACPSIEFTLADAAIVDAVAARLPEQLNLPANRVVLVFDSDRERIYAGRPEAPDCPDRDWVARQRLATSARANGMSVIDTAPIFAASWKANHKPLDRSPVDGHWNPLAHALVAQAVSRRLTRTPT